MLFKQISKIPCYMLVFDQVDIIKKTLEFITKYSDQLDLILIENPSPNTPQINQIIDDLGNKGLIKRYYIFESNITNNAFDVVTSNEQQLIKKSPFVILTDGDLTSSNTGWLKEEAKILKKHQDVFACGISLELSNLPLQVFPEAKNWIPPDKNVYKDFFETLTGLHMLMLRGSDLYSFMTWKNKNNLHFVDGDMHRYSYEALNKKWSRTKKSTAYHLTWDLYNSPDHPYTKLKTGKSFEDTWYHNKKAAYTLKEY